MVFSRGLLLKGTAVLLTLTAVATVGLTVFPLNNTSTLEGSISKQFNVEENVSLKTLNDQLKELGIKEKCYLDREDSEKTCEINENELKNIRFSNKVDGTDLVIEGLNDAKLNLKIKKAKDTGVFGEGIRFGFEVTGGDVTIKSGVTNSENPILLKEGTNPEFKRNQENKLEKAWTASLLGKKVGITCEEPSQCSPSEPIKILDGEEVKSLTLSGDNSNKKITFLKDQKDYNQGFKFNVSEEMVGNDSSVKLAVGDYEAKYQTLGWSLVKKDT